MNQRVKVAEFFSQNVHSTPFVSSELNKYMEKRKLMNVNATIHASFHNTAETPKVSTNFKWNNHPTPKQD